MKKPFFRKYLITKKNENYLFTFYKGNKDVNMHISINEEFKFKGLVYKRTNLSEVDFVFNGRYFDFQYKGGMFPKFHVHLRMKQKAKFNIIFKAELRDRKVRKKKKLIKQVATYLVTDKTFKQKDKITGKGWHNEFIQDLQAMDVYAGNERAR